jgi:aspartate racemase
MATLEQRWVPGVVGISTYVDHVYQREMQISAMEAAGTRGPINQLRTVTVTLDFNRLVANLQSGRREAAEEQVAAACQALQGAGADFVVVTSGTTSTLTARARQRVAIPFLDLAEAAWDEVGQAAVVGLLSTRHAAAGGIFQAAAARRRAALVLPASATAERVDRVIFGELISGRVTDDGVRILSGAVAELVDGGAAAVVLGNTDMTLAADRLQPRAAVPLVDSARAHARAAARAALAGRLSET